MGRKLRTEMIDAKYGSIIQIVTQDQVEIRASE